MPLKPTLSLLLRSDWAFCNSCVRNMNVERVSSEGSDCPKNRPERPSEFPFLLSSCPSVTLKFVEVCFRMKMKSKPRGTVNRIICHGSTELHQTTSNFQERTVLHGISGMVSPGEILAVLGPSGSGKSTLLNALGGRLHGEGFSGTVLANDQKLTKSVLRQTGFVTQDDVLYPHLTVGETLIFCCLLRLPKTLSKEEKITVSESVILELGLVNCRDTIIGNSFIRGVSGGERKRVSIAMELLLNPSLLILDEPTSGLDSTAAHRLMATLESLAQKGKTIVTSMHQPSSRVYQMFTSVLLLSDGKSLYFGKASAAMNYFESVGFSPSFPMNPADFLLDLANGVCQCDNANEDGKPDVKLVLVSSYNSLLARMVKSACMESTPARGTVFAGKHSPDGRRTSNCSNALSSWVDQFRVLLHRNLKERKHETFNNLRVFQVMTAAVLAGLMWWRSDFRDIQDRLGLLFFISIFWGVFPSFNSVFVFPQERAIFVKERASSMYSLSSYFMARIVADLPMELILPTIFLTVSYWMADLNPGFGSFVSTLLVLLGYVLVSQGLGLALGAAIMDAKQASTIVTVTMLAFVLTGGFYVHRVPMCMSWIKYISTTYYSYRLLINIQYGEGKNISDILGCSGAERSTTSCKFIEDDLKGQIGSGMCIAALGLMFVGYRLLAYLALRRVKA